MISVKKIKAIPRSDIIFRKLENIFFIVNENKK